jgi:hypothetical protein
VGTTQTRLDVPLVKVRPKLQFKVMPRSLCSIECRGEQRLYELTERHHFGSWIDITPKLWLG